MLKIITPTEHTFDLVRLRADVARVTALCPFFDKTHQISLRHRQASMDRDVVARFLDGTGRLKDIDAGTRSEADFCQLHEAVADSYIGEIFRFVEARFPRARGRYRIRRLLPKSCIAWHSDDAIKYHIPVYTNRDCFFVTKWGAHRMPEAGRLYVVRTDVFHTAMNTSTEDRIHLAIDTTAERSAIARLRSAGLKLLSR